MTQPAPRHTQIASVQILRALAALTVVFGHAQDDALFVAGKNSLAFARSHLLPWGVGVDLFFVISGFIMVHASARLFGVPGAGKEFLRRRLIRIVPLYWLLTGAFLTLAQIFGGMQNKPPLTGVNLLASLFFWPLDIFSEGHPRPLYALGWTLNYEMFFYVLFALFIGLPRARAVLAVAGVLLAGVVLGALAAPGWTPLAFWTQPIVLEFALGMGLALAWRTGFRLPLWASLAAVLAGLGVLLADLSDVAGKPEHWIAPNDIEHLAFWGGPAALILAGCVLAREQSAHLLHNGVAWFWVALGDASYALYLIHPFVIVAVRKVWLALGLHHSLGLWPLVAASVAGAIAVAFATYHGVEKPMTSLLQRVTAPQPNVASEGKASSR